MSAPKRPRVQAAVLARDAVFHLLYGADHALMLRIIAMSAQRVAEYTRTHTVYHLATAARASTLAAQVVLIVLLHVDERLRDEFLQGVFDSDDLCQIRFEPMCPHKATMLFSTMREHVLNPWVRHEANTPDTIVKAMRSEYLAS